MANPKRDRLKQYGLIALEPLKMTRECVEPSGDGGATFRRELRRECRSYDARFRDALERGDLLEPAQVLVFQVDVESRAAHSGIPSSGSSAARRAVRVSAGSSRPGVRGSSGDVGSCSSLSSSNSERRGSLADSSTSSCRTDCLC